MINILRFNNCENIEELYALYYGNSLNDDEKDEFATSITNHRTIKNTINIHKLLNKINKNIIYDYLKISSINLDDVNTIYDIHHDIYQEINNKLSTNIEKNKAPIICFSMISYDFRIQRNQHLCKLLADRGHIVIYLNTTFSTNTKMTELSKNLYQVNLSCGDNNVNVYKSKLKQENIIKLLQSIEEIKKKFNFSFFISYIANPFWYQLVKYINNTHIIYDCMDYHEGFGNISDVVVENEKILLKNCETLIMTSPILAEKLCVKKNKYKLLRNACDYDYFSSIQKKNKQKKIIGYYGAVSDWFDAELVKKIAIMFNDCIIYIIGNISCNDPKNTQSINELKKLSNVTFFGEIQYQDLHEYVCFFDVGIIPFIINPLIECTNPVKLYEMLSMGLPIVLTNLNDVQTIGKNHLYYLSETHEIFLKNIKTAIDENNESLQNERRYFASFNKWDNRVDTFENIIDNINPMISIVLLCFNNWKLTEKCIESVVKNTNYNNYELIVVNNNSSDETFEKLKHYNMQNFRVINNQQNYGFALGMNIGSLHSFGSYVVLLNNDTYCMKDWLYPLVKPFLKYDNCGVVSPVTNNCGNEIKQFIMFNNIEDLKKKSKKLQINRKYEIKTHERVPFFAPMVKKDDFFRCGLLDSNYGRGGWEDDDILYRYNIMNKKNYYTFGSFIYHQESATITDGYVPTTSLNKSYYEKKWNTIWTLPKYKYIKINVKININDDDLFTLFKHLEHFIKMPFITTEDDDDNIVIDTYSDKNHINTIIHSDYYIFDDYKYNREKWGLLNLYSVIFTKKYCR